MEACVGCGTVTQGEHPIVGIGRLDLDANGKDDELAAHPVCDLCWKDPAHRTRRTLKVHFHLRKDAAAGLAAAKASQEASKRGEDLGLGH